MTDVISVIGQKGGVGKSMVAQAISAESSRKGQATVLVDLDISQRTSHQWGETRRMNNLKPAFDVRLVNPEDYSKTYNYRDIDPSADLIVIDAPGWSDEKTKLLAAHSDYLVLPTGASVADLDPTIRLMHELVERGIPTNRMATALNRVKSTGEIKFARERIAAAGYTTLPGMLRDMPSYRTIQNVGHAATEAEAKNMRDEARQLVSSIQKGLVQSKSMSHTKPEIFKNQPEQFTYVPEQDNENKVKQRKTKRRSR